MADGHGSGARQSRVDHRETAARANRHGPAAIQGRRNALLRSRRRKPSAGTDLTIGTLIRMTRTMDEPAKAGHDGPMPARKQRLAPAATAPTAELERGGILTIDLAAIVANWRELARRAAPAQCAAVVKADGYGCGIERVTAALAKAGCATFFVATLAEARQARAAAPQDRKSVV